MEGLRPLDAWCASKFCISLQALIDVIRWMVDLQETAFERLDLPFQRSMCRRLHAIDCQGLCCETEKYCREVAPELVRHRPDARTHLYLPSGVPGR
ncbi:MAG: nucleotide kinase domain-containing protein [Pseudonocardiaceae bacterium]